MALLTPYLMFKRDARPALDFYQSVLGGTVEAMAFGDTPMGLPIAPDDAALIAHGQLTTDAGLVLMASDTGEKYYEGPMRGCSVALTGGPADLEYIQSAYEKLVVGATDVEKFAKAPWGDHYGHLTDRFGVHWSFDVHP